MSGGGCAQTQVNPGEAVPGAPYGGKSVPAVGTAET